MSSSKFSNDWKLPHEDDSENVVQIARQLSDITQSLIPLYQNKTSIDDNLNMEFKKVRVESGKSQLLTATKIVKITGVFVIDTGGKSVTSQSMKIMDVNKIEIMVEYTGTGLNPMTFLILGE